MFTLHFCSNMALNFVYVTKVYKAQHKNCTFSSGKDCQHFVTALEKNKYKMLWYTDVMRKHNKIPNSTSTADV